MKKIRMLNYTSWKHNITIVSLLMYLLCTTSCAVLAQNKTLDNPNSLEGQIIVDPENPQWLKYNGGEHLFICGAGDPENFLYRGLRRPNGTRDGDQMELIEKMKGTGANSIHAIAFRSGKYGGDGADDHNPFIDSDIAKKIDDNILNQWETWFSEMDKNGIITYLFIYDDEIKLEGDMDWKLTDAGELHHQEQYFIKSLITKFKHHKNLIWVVMEGASKINGHENHLLKVAELIRKTDTYEHPIGISENNKLDFYNYANDENIDLFSLIYYNTNTPLKIHNMLVEAKNIARDRYAISYTESLKYGKGEVMRKKNWAAAMAGAYVMVYQMNIKDTDISDLKDCGRLKTFFESTEFNEMKSKDELALWNTEYVLANINNNDVSSAIAYSSQTNERLGVKNISDGIYNFIWFDCVTGETIVKSKVKVKEGFDVWRKPSTMGQEVALYLKKLSNE